MGRNTAGDNRSPLVTFEIAFRKVCPHLAELRDGAGRYRYREIAIVFRGPGDYLGRVKALDTEDCRPVIAFAAGTTYEAALCRLDRAVQDGRWKLDRYSEVGWAN